MKTSKNSPITLGMPGLLYALSIASMLSGRKSLPILEHCVIESPIAGSEILVPTLKHTDLNMWVSIPLVGTEGSLDNPVALPMKKLYELCNQLDKGLEVQLEPRFKSTPSQEKDAEGFSTPAQQLGGARISQTDSEGDPVLKLEMFGLPAEDFPGNPQFERNGFVKFTGVSLTSALKTVAGALSNDETRVILTGVLMKLSNQGGTARFVATDTHRLHITKSIILENTSGSNTPDEVVLSGELVRLLLRIVRDTDLVCIEFSLRREMVRVTISQQQTLEGTRDIQVYANTIEGQFPAYQRVIPTGLSESVCVPRKALQAGIKRVGIVARDNANRVVLEPNGKRLVLRGESQQLGEAQANVKGAEVIGMEFQWAQNCKYMLDVLANLSDEHVTIMGTEPLRPLIWYAGKPQSGDAWAEGDCFVCMPMQVI